MEQLTEIIKRFVLLPFANISCVQVQFIRLPRDVMMTDIRINTQLPAALGTERGMIERVLGLLCAID